MMHGGWTTSGWLYGVNGESGESLLFAVEAADSAEAGRRVAVIALMLGIADVSRETVEELDSDFDVSSVPTFYEAYFCGEAMSCDAGTAAGVTIH